MLLRTTDIKNKIVLQTQLNDYTNAAIKNVFYLELVTNSCAQ